MTIRSLCEYSEDWYDIPVYIIHEVEFKIRLGFTKMTSSDVVSY